MLADDTGMPSYRGVYKRTVICCRSSCKWLLQVRPFATVYFKFLAFQCFQMLSKKQPWQWPLTLEKKHTASQTGQTSQINLQNEAPIEVCFFQIGPAGTPQLLPRSGRNSRATHKVQLLQGRVAQDFQQVCGPICTFGVIVKAPGVLKRGRWDTVGINGWQFVATALASDFCKSDR